MGEDYTFTSEQKMLIFELEQAYETMRSTYNIIYQFVAITFAIQVALIGFGIEFQNAYLIITCGFISFFLLYEIHSTSRVLTVAAIVALSLENKLEIDNSHSIASALIATIRNDKMLKRYQEVALKHDEDVTKGWDFLKSEPSLYSFKYSRTVRIVWGLGFGLVVLGIILLLVFWSTPSPVPIINQLGSYLYRN